MRTYEEERVTVQTRTVLRDAAATDGEDEYTQQITTSHTLGEPSVQREEITETVTRVENFEGLSQNEVSRAEKPHSRGK